MFASKSLFLNEKRRKERVPSRLYVDQGARPASIYGRRSCHFSFIRREERWLDWLKARPFVFFERKVEALGSRHPWNGSGGPVAGLSLAILDQPKKPWPIPCSSMGSHSSLVSPGWGEVILSGPIPYPSGLARNQIST
ncbi:hypothetical protein V6N13_034901 [Hibiscus sabdariffa]